MIIHTTNFNSLPLVLSSSSTKIRYYKLSLITNACIFKRFMKSSSRQILNRIAQNPTNPLSAKPYATNKVFTPKPTSSSNEGLNNNPAIPFIRKNKPSTVVQHPEWVKDICDKPGCAGKYCLGLCGEKTSSESIAHFTHSDDDKHKPQKVAQTDLNGNPKPLYAKPYEKPHKTSGESYNLEEDKKKTESLNEKLQNIFKNNKNE